MISTYYALDASFRYTPDAADTLTVSETVDQVVDHLYDLNVEDLNVIMDEQSLLVHISLVLPARSGDSIETVVGKGMGTLRTAFHACDAGTPTWPSSTWEMLQSVSIARINALAEADDRAAEAQDLVPA